LRHGLELHNVAQLVRRRFRQRHLDRDVDPHLHDATAGGRGDVDPVGGALVAVGVDAAGGARHVNALELNRLARRVAGVGRERDLHELGEDARLSQGHGRVWRADIPLSAYRTRTVSAEHGCVSLLHVPDETLAPTSGLLEYWITGLLDYVIIGATPPNQVIQ